MANTVNVTTTSMGVFKAKAFKKVIDDNIYDGVYLTIGKINTPSNTAVANVNVSTNGLKCYWNDMVGAKKISGTDLKHVIYRNNWIANTVYAQWDDSKDMQVGKSNANFYVVTSDWNVYKCISNNNQAPSTFEPTTVNASIVNTPDGYTWKYLYTVSTNDRLRFSTADFIPVTTLEGDNNSMQWQVQEQTVPGAIYLIKVTNPGAGYNSATISTIITGDGIEATANAIVANTGQVRSILMTNYGEGYSNARITILGNGYGNNATANVILGEPLGHGQDALNELGGNKIMISTRIRPSETPNLPLGISFSQYGLIADPLHIATGNVSTNTYISQTTDIFVTGVALDYEIGEFVYQGSGINNPEFIGLVADWQRSNATLKLTNAYGKISIDTIYGANTSATSFVTSHKKPDLIKNTGELLFINNIDPRSRNESQSEEFKIVLEF